MKVKSIHKTIACIITFILLTLVLTPIMQGSSLNQPLEPQISDLMGNNKDIQDLSTLPGSKIYQQSIQRDNQVHLNIPTIPVNLTVQKPGPISYFISTLSDVPTGYDITNGTYLGWCTDLINSIQSNQSYSITVYNSYNTTLPSHLYHQNWSKINYILNNKQGSNWSQVQNALFYILDFGDEGLNAIGWSMVNNATLYGTNYTPGLGDIVAVILDAGQNIQRTIIEVDIPEFILTITIVGNGSVNILPNQPSYLYGTTVELTAVPEVGWEFSYWDGDITGDDNPIEIIIDTDKAVTAIFNKTPDTTPPSVSIVTPENAIYLFGQKIIPFKFPLVFRIITVEVNATDDDTGVDRVEFYIDGQLVENDTEAPYEYNWKELDSFPIRHTIKAIAYDNANNEAFDELEVWKWRFHPVLIAFFLFMTAILVRIGD